MLCPALGIRPSVMAMVVEDSQTLWRSGFGSRQLGRLDVGVKQGFRVRASRYSDGFV